MNFFYRFSIDIPNSFNKIFCIIKFFVNIKPPQWFWYEPIKRIIMSMIISKAYLSQIIQEQVKLVEDSFFKSCLSQFLLGPFPFRTLSNIYDGASCGNNQGSKSYYFHKKNPRLMSKRVQKYQLVFTCSIETLEQGVKYVQS